MTTAHASLSPRQQRLLAAAQARDLACLAVVDEVVPDDVGEVPTEALLAVDASLGIVERRRLFTVARVLPHLPALRAAVESGRASFDLAARVCRTASSHRLTVAHLALLDATLGDLLAERRDADDVHDRVLDHIVALRPDEAEAVETAAVDRVTFLPDLFGGGEIHVEATATTYPVLVGAIDHVVAREDLLDRGALRPGDDRDEVAVAHNHGVLCEARGAALATMARDVLAGRSADGASRPPLPSLQVVVPLAALVGENDEPARLLTGGRMTAGTLRRVVSGHGADVTAVVTDGEGNIVGVGRRSRVAPDWLDRLTKALQPRCVVPGCRARVTDLDHARRWADGGATDIDNLDRLCRRHHVEKDTDGAWRVTPSPSGAVTVRHRASGWQATTRPWPTGPPSVPRAAAAKARQARQPRLPLAPAEPPHSDDDLPF